MQKVLDQYKKRALTVDNFCFKYSVGRTLAYAEMAAGRLKSITIGRKRLIPSESGEEWFTSYYPHPKTDEKTEAKQDDSDGEASRAA